MGLRSIRIKDEAGVTEAFSIQDLIEKRGWERLF
jgi:hypothetical protein